MHLEQDASGFRLERTVECAGRAAGICIRLERLPTLAVLVISNRQISGEKKNLLPIFVNKRAGRVNTRRKAQESGSAAALVGFVERPRQNFLLNTCRIACRSLPSLRHVEGMKLVVDLLHDHLNSPGRVRRQRASMKPDWSLQRSHRQGHSSTASDRAPTF